MDLSKLKQSLAGTNLSGLIKTRQTDKPRLISDIEFLNQEQYEFLESHTQTKFYTFMQQYWGTKMVQHNITCKTANGEVLNVDPKSIRVIDKRWKGASHCICGKAIRYEYWIQNYGPIGSVHICEHTNLDKTLIRDITAGYKKENELRTDLVKMLADLKDAGKTYEEWADGYQLSDKIKSVNLVGNIESRKLIEDLCRLKLPLTEKLRQSLDLAIRRAQTLVPHPPAQPLTTSVSTYAAQQAEANPVPNAYGTLLGELNTSWAAYRSGNYGGVSSHHLSALENLLKRLQTGNPTQSQVQYSQGILRMLKDAIEKPVSSGWRNAQVQAGRILRAIVASDPQNSFAKSLMDGSAKGDLTIKQLDSIYTIPSPYARAGLFYQYQSLMNNNNLVAINPQDYR